MKKLLLFVSCLLLLVLCKAQSPVYIEETGVVYTSSQDAYSQQQCRVNLYFPKDTKDFVTVIWFHGGGLTGGNNAIPEALKNKGIGVISVGYRFTPKVRVEDILHDAADAVKWSYDHIEKYGGNRDKFVLAGHSAGAYISLMLGLNKNYLAEKGIDIDRFMGIGALSSQTITHVAARKEKGIPELQPLIDQWAPLYWVRKDAPPIMLVTGDRELEMLGRYEENAYLERMLKLVGHKTVSLMELDGYDHGMTFPAFPLLLKQIDKWSKNTQ